MLLVIVYMLLIEKRGILLLKWLVTFDLDAPSKYNRMSMCTSNHLIVPLPRPCNYTQKLFK